MKSIDDILSEAISPVLSGNLKATLDLDSWTKENRDQKLLSMDSIGMEVAELADKVAKESLQIEIDGKPYMYWKVTLEFMAVQLEFLNGLRLECDVSTDEELENYPFDYDWIQKNIRILNTKIGELSSRLDRTLNPEAEVDEL